MERNKVILKPSPKNSNAPSVLFDENELFIQTGPNAVYNYAVSTGYGSVIQKGRFQEEIVLQLKLIDSTNVYQLSLFNATNHFVYNFRVSGENATD